jgi:hypothetical protein
VIGGGLICASWAALLLSRGIRAARFEFHGSRRLCAVRAYVGKA